MTRRTRFILIISSIALAGLAMALWVRSFGVSGAEFQTLFDHLILWPVVPLLALVVGHVALSSWRWSLIEEVLSGVRPRFGPAFATGAFAQGLGTFLPSPLVNVACRGLANRLSGTSGLRGALSGGIDQVADFAVVLLLAIPAIAAFVHRDILIYLWGCALMVPLGLGMIFLLPTAIRWFRPPAFLRRVHDAASRFDRVTLCKLYGISLARFISLTLMNIAVHAAIGTVTIAAILVGVPLVALATSVAMLPGAFGISEWSFSVIFAGFSIGAADIVLFVLANRILLTGTSLAVAAATLSIKASGWLVGPSRRQRPDR
ncbi:lysylphosphatidylglycerol synthase domain-containing protein [Sphingopyxis sp. Root1497]|uniref:lysylphosphatidylglycerol synthase domain-containing protein n=1 Tax=Sphingopyxis sp. Root1497 TaxID=1736474 RepID=UPI0006F97532|nr:lysylphosphatidylglycerol synthase domain-containing protein [Sphingopyxis sp. Root1497]